MQKVLLVLVMFSVILWCILNSQYNMFLDFFIVKFCSDFILGENTYGSVDIDVFKIIQLPLQ